MTSLLLLLAVIQSPFPALTRVLIQKRHSLQTLARFPSLYSVAIRAGLFHLTKSDSISARLPCSQIRQFVECRPKETTGASLFVNWILSFSRTCLPRRFPSRCTRVPPRRVQLRPKSVVLGGNFGEESQ